MCSICLYITCTVLYITQPHHFAIKGFDDREFDNVPSRRDCEELCLRERSFKCRSAEFDTVALTCTLSRESRRTKPKSFREARNIDYLENGCIDSSEFNIKCR